MFDSNKLKDNRKNNVFYRHFNEYWMIITLVNIDGTFLLVSWKFTNIQNYIQFSLFIDLLMIISLGSRQ